MKWRYAIHPNDLCLGEIEAYYQDMAAAGWRLVKRGGYLSRFEKAEPMELQYHVVVSGAVRDADAIPEEKISEYKAAGWEFVTCSGLMHIFCAPKGCSIPDFSLTAEQRTATQKTIRRTIIFLLLTILLAVLWCITANQPISSGGMGGLCAQLIKAWYEESGILLLLAVGVGFLLWNALCELRRDCVTYRCLKRGLPLRRTAFTGWKWAKRVRLGLLVLCLLYAGGERMRVETYAMPEETAGPYVLLSDLGVSGERTVNYAEEASQVSHHHTLMGEYWDCREFVRSGTKDTWLYQDLYVLRHPAMVEGLVKSLMRTATFAQTEQEFKTVTIPGLDQAYVTERLECIAVKGSRVLMMTHIFENQQDMTDALHSVADVWSAPR